jgi:hypothetical protein
MTCLEIVLWPFSVNVCVVVMLILCLSFSIFHWGIRRFYGCVFLSGFSQFLTVAICLALSPSGFALWLSMAVALLGKAGMLWLDEWGSLAASGAGISCNSSVQLKVP